MKIRIFLLFVLLLSPCSSEAVQRVRARPVLKADKEYNAILLHVAQHFVLTIPDGKTMDDIDYAIRCTFVIAPNGALRELEIENDIDGWTGLFDGSAARQTAAWLRNAVLEGMAFVPPFDLSQIRASKGSKKRTVVFSFGRKAGQSTQIPFMGFNTQIVDANLNQSIQEQMESAREGKTPGEAPMFGMTRQEAERRYQQGEKVWTDFTSDNIKSTMKPKYDPHRHSTPPTLKTQPPQPAPNDSIPRIDIAISLQ